MIDTILRQVTDLGLLKGELLFVEELEERWRTSAPEYMAAAVPQIAEYPAVAIAWAGYLGVGAAAIWDNDWESYAEVEDLYSLISKPRGFDEMDEYVMEGLLGMKLDSEEAQKLESVMRSIAHTAQGMIHKENIEAQSVLAFHIFARTTKVFYKVGIAMGLHLLGYSYVKAKVEES